MAPKRTVPKPSMPNIGPDSDEEVESVEGVNEAETSSKPKKGATKNVAKGNKNAEKVTELDDENQPTKPKKATAKKATVGNLFVIFYKSEENPMLRNLPENCPNKGH